MRQERLAQRLRCAQSPAAPLRSGALTYTGLAVDPTGQVYVANGASILVFAAGANGNVAPVRTLTGALTSITGPNSLATDASGNVYAVNSLAGTILEFSSTANGNVAPLKSISGGSTALASAYGVAVDTAGNIYATTQSSGTLGILEFAPTANGNTTPTRTIQGTNTGINAIAGIRVDGVGTVYTVIINNQGFPAIQEYSSTASGNVAPTAAISSPAAWTMSISGQFAIK